MISYDPQRLLTDQRGSSLWSNELLRQYRNAYPALTEMWKSISRDADNEYIDFEPTYRDETILYVNSAGKVVSTTTFRVPINRNLAPFVAPLGWETEAMREGREAHQYILGRGRLSWGEPDVHVNNNVEFVDVDYSWLENRGCDFEMYHDHQLGKLAEAFGISYDDLMRDFDKNPQMATYALGALFTKPVATEPVKKQPSYLDHDPTKSHKRRKRK